MRTVEQRKQRGRLSIRLGDSERRMAQLAADVVGVSLGRFIRDAARERARQVIAGEAPEGRRFRETIVEKAGS